MDIPLRFSFEHALAKRTGSASILVQVVLDNGVWGYGEALPRPYVTGETVASCLSAISQRIAPRLTAVDFSQSEDLKAAMLNLHRDSALSDSLAAMCGVELALVDALARSKQQNLYEFFAVPRKVPRVRYSMVIGATNPGRIRKMAWLTHLLGIRDIKLKMGVSLAENEANIRLVRRWYRAARLRVDANCAWNLDSAQRHFDVFRQQGVIACEQPLAKDDIQGHTQLVSHYPDILICADESLCSYADAEQLIAEKAATCFNIRLSKNGGLCNAMAIYALAKRHGICCQLGAQVGETALISAAGRFFAGMTGDLCFHEGSFGTWLLDTDVTRQPYRFGYGGKGTTWLRTHGLGINVALDPIAQYMGAPLQIPMEHSNTLMLPAIA
jgi:L-alanine-DL-glutamate epimerase-like enolase superfamily enzyme